MAEIQFSEIASERKMSTFSKRIRAETFDRNVMSFFLRRNAEISGNFPGNLLAGCGNSFRKLSSSTPEILTYPKRDGTSTEREWCDNQLRAAGRSGPGAAVTTFR